MSKRASGGRSAGAGKRLALRAALLCAPPPLALLAGLHGAQLALCVGAALAWTALEAAIVFRLRAADGCASVPFVLRLLLGVLLDAQGCWLLWYMQGTMGEAGVGALRGGGAAVDSAAADAAAAAAVDERGAAATGNKSIPGQDAWWLKASLPPVAVKDRVDTVTVVLPCANETNFVVRTVKSVFESTPGHELEEILVVDDDSYPPIATLFSEKDLKMLKARILRHDVAEGLIRSKKHGGDVARGDVVVFFDCHVKPAEGWTKQILKLIRENNRRIVVPAITALDTEAWKEVSPKGGATKMCLTWNADFHWCNGYPGPYVPIMSGGLLALSRWWWQATGGYDEDMHAWGGENLDQSLRTWLCGGEILAAKESRVAHMWRDFAKPHTRLHYSIPTDHVRRNRMRAARAWMGPWADKVATFPEFEDFAPGGRLNIGTLESYGYYKEKLRCKTFEWYLNRFKDWYVGTGSLPSDTYNLRETTTGLCLTLSTSAEKGRPEKFHLGECNKESEMQRFHGANQVRGSPGRCCSGIKVWNFDSCLVSTAAEVSSSPCDPYAGRGGQHAEFDQGYIRWVDRPHPACLTARDGRPDEKLRARSRGAAEGDPVKFAPCAAPDGHTPKGGQEFRRQSEKEDGSFQIAHPGTDLCLGVRGEGRKGSLAMMACGSSASADVTRWTSNSGILKNVHWSLCIDAGGSQAPIPYPCYPAGTNPKQMFKLHENGWIEQPRAWADNGRNRWPAKCLDSRPAEPVALKVLNCSQVRAPNWEQVWHSVPLETQLWSAVQGRLPA